ncbi:MAG: helix-turn-helix domain-containing protein [Bacillota bacterium]
MVRNRLAQILNDRRITQAELARLCGVRSETLGRIKRQKKPDAEVMLLIAKHLGMAVEEIFWIEGTPE